MNNEEFCQKILKSDDKIRFISIYDDGDFYHKMKEGKQSYLTQIPDARSNYQLLGSTLLDPNSTSFPHGVSFKVPVLSCDRTVTRP